MFKPGLPLLALFALPFLSCKRDIKYNYAIKDFRNSLRPYLTKIVSKRVVTKSDSALNHMATDKELTQLGQSEHPVLRASAFREMLKRKSFDRFEIIIKHLDDTAIVDIDGGEFGIWSRTVSDDILQEAEWNTQEAKNKTIEQVLTKHNYLRSAYTILEQLEPQEKYYSFIKDMATRPRRLTGDGYELDFDDIEYALYGLAKFKKPNDAKVIKEQMTQNVWRLSSISFKLITEFPDTNYFDVLQQYHRRKFYSFSGNRPGGFSGLVSDRAAPEDFIQALILQQSEKSARLLDTMLNYLPMQTCMPDRVNIMEELISAIWEHPCPPYARLRERIKTKAKKILNWQMNITLDSSYIRPTDTITRKIRWYQ